MLSILQRSLTVNVFAKSTVCVMLLAVGSAFAQAKKANDDGSYAEVSYIRWNIKSDSSSQTINPTGLRAIYGFGGNGIAYEAHLGLPMAAGSYTTVAGDDADVPGNIKIDTKITSLGLFAKLYTKASDDLELFGRLGMSSLNMTAEVSTSNATASAKASDKSTAWGYGVGVKYKVGSSTSVVFDYTGYNKQSSSTMGLGVAFSF